MVSTYSVYGVSVRVLTRTHMPEDCAETVVEVLDVTFDPVRQLVQSDAVVDPVR